MPHRAHLTSVRLSSALRESFAESPYTVERLFKDLVAGLTVGIIAIPLSMALAIASGVPPQHGLYTAAIAGVLIAVTGGSRYSISGPTAAFVVILHPVAQQFGLAGLAVASVLAGLLLVVFALARLGRLIEYIPEPVTLGFTSGIAIVIATLQVRDFFGLQIEHLPENWFAKIVTLGGHLGGLDPGTVVVAAATLATLVLWPRLRLPVPGHLPAVLIGVLLALTFAALGDPVATIGSRFTYTLADGTTGNGIPPVFPGFMLPWHLPGPQGAPVEWSMDTLRQLMPAAFSIAMLGAIESLLCAVVLDGMTGRRHHANGELLGQGIGNLVVPFFGGITATAAIARSAANLRAGAQTPISAVIHALVVLAALLVLAPWLGYVPMPTMAALLLVVAWNMSEAHKVFALVKRAPMGDVLVLATCLSLTVLFDMVIAITVGVVLSALLFMRDVSRMTRVTDISANRKQVPAPLPDGWSVYKINGALFFAAADRVFSELRSLCRDRRGVVLYLDGVGLLDAGGLSAFERFVAAAREQGTEVIVADLQFQPLKTLARAGVKPIEGSLRFTPTLADALSEVTGAAAPPSEVLPPAAAQPRP